MRRRANDAEDEDERAGFDTRMVRLGGGLAAVTATAATALLQARHNIL